MVKYSEVEKTHKIRLLRDSVFSKLLGKMVGSVENKGFYRTQVNFAIEPITEANIYDSGLV